MKSIFWKNIQHHFEQILNLSEPQRDHYLETLRGKDPDTAFILDEFIQNNLNNTNHLHDRWSGTLQGLADVIEEKWLGKILGEYQINRLISTGGIGVVFEANRIDNEFKKSVAIKLLRTGKVEPAAVSRFINERQIQAQIEHPFIARVLDGGTTEDGMPYIVMEYVIGNDLPSHCRKYRLNLNQRLSLFLNICDAVSYLHKNLIIHSDIKSDNIIVDENGRPKLLDFGISKMVDIASTKDKEPNLHQQSVLTIGYASPEQLSCRPLSTTTDIYSLGVVLAELVNDNSQHQASLPSHTASNTANSIYPNSINSWFKDYRLSILKNFNINTQNERVPAHKRKDIYHVVEHALEEGPLERTGSADELSSELKAILSNRPISYRKQDHLYRLKKFVIRNTYPTLFAGAFLLSSTVFSVSTFFQLGKVKQERDTANFVTVFMADTFLNASPLVALDKPVTTQELLDNASQRIKSDLNEAPIHQARLMRALGTVYQGFEAFSQAEDLLLQSLSINRQHLKEEDEQTTRSLFRLALIQRDIRKFDEAEKHLRQVISNREKQLGKSHTRTIAALYHLGTTLYNNLKYTDALITYQDLLNRITPDTHPQNKPITLNSMGNIYRDRGQYQLAYDSYLQSMDAYTEMGAPAKLALTIPKENMAMLLLSIGQPSQAKKLQQEALNIRNSTLPANHSVTMQGLENMAIINIHLGDTETSLTSLTKVLTDKQALFESTDIKTIETQHRLSKLFLEVNDIAQAYTHANAAYVALDDTDDHMRLAATINTTLGVIAMEQGDTDRAEQSLLTGQAFYAENANNLNIESKESLSLLAELYANTNRCMEAEKLLQNTNSLTNNQELYNLSLEISSTITKAQCYLSSDQFERANKLLASAANLLDNVPKDSRQYRRLQSIIKP